MGILNAIENSWLDWSHFVIPSHYFIIIDPILKSRVFIPNVPPLANAQQSVQSSTTIPGPTSTTVTPTPVLSSGPKLQPLPEGMLPTLPAPLTLPPGRLLFHHS